jgi:uncharacterized protein
LKKIKNLLFWFLFVNVFLVQNSFAQFNIPKKPDFQTSVYDFANVLNANEKEQLETKLIQYSDSTSTQIVIVTVETINGEDIGILAPKWGHEWGVGQAKEDNGVFILLAKTERKIWISSGYGVEDKLTAGVTGDIIRNEIIPEFKAGSYYIGLDRGADAVFDVLKGKYKGTRIEDTQEIPFETILFFIIIFIILLIIISKNNRGNGSGLGRTPSLLETIILSNSGRNSGGYYGGGFSGGGSSGGGGFGGGFGGGGFSGGGAGGSW